MNANFDVDSKVSEDETNNVVAGPNWVQPGSAELAAL